MSVSNEDAQALCEQIAKLCNNDGGEVFDLFSDLMATFIAQRVSGGKVEQQLAVQIFLTQLRQKLGHEPPDPMVIHPAQPQTQQ